MFQLFIAELKRTWDLIKSYPSEEVTLVVIYAAFFYFLFRGATYMAGPTAAFGTRLDSIFVGYATWMLLMETSNGISYNLLMESEQGTLQQLMLSPYDLIDTLLARTAAKFVKSLVSISLVSSLLMLFTGCRVHLSLQMILPLLTIFLAATGLGLIIGALVLVFRRVDSVMMISQWVLLLAIMTPFESMGKQVIILSSLLPVCPSAIALRSILVNQSFNWLYVFLSLVNAALYLAIGIIVFRMMEKRAKRRGLMGAF